MVVSIFGFGLGDRSANQIFLGWLSSASPFKIGCSAIHSMLYGFCYAYERTSQLFLNLWQNVARWKKIQELQESFSNHSDTCMYIIVQTL